jgi:hypothetical protein
MNVRRGLVALGTQHTWRMTRDANNEFGDAGVNGFDGDSSGKV